VQRTANLETADQDTQQLFSLYQKSAVAEGEGMGAGGILLNVVDFPALIAIKMKYLFELAHVYGYDTKHFSERVFVLKVFQLTFSGTEQRARLLNSIKRWDAEKAQWHATADYSKNMDWETSRRNTSTRSTSGRCCRWCRVSEPLPAPGPTTPFSRSYANRQ